MPSSFAPNGTLGTDQCLQAFLKAQNQEDAAGELARLMEMTTPLIISSLSHRRGNTQPDDLEDAVSEARTHLLLRLQRLRDERSSRAELEGSGATILDFGAYVVTVARTAAAQLHRRRHPARAMLLNRLQYLLENRTHQCGFSVWAGPGGETWTGFEAWADAHRFSTQTGERLGRLLADARPIALEIFGAGGAESALPLAEIVARLFRWLDEPIRLRDLSDAVAEWQGIHAGRGEAPGIDSGDNEPFAALLPSKEPSPHDELRWKEYLRWLLQEASRLTLRQRSAFLLHSSCLREMELLGLTGVRQAAALLEIPPERMVEHWAKLPLEDRLIGTILGVATQRVINLRKVARGILGRAWQSFLQEN